MINEPSIMISGSIAIAIHDKMLEVMKKKENFCHGDGVTRPEKENFCHGDGVTRPKKENFCHKYDD